MDILKSLVKSLNENEVLEFKKFIQRQKHKENRKDLRLFLAIKTEKNLNKEDLLKSLNLKNLNSYHTLRKRLYSELSEYITLKSLDEDHSKSARANNYYNLAKHLFQRDIPEMGWKTILKAEKLAFLNGLHELLHPILLLQLGHAHLNPNSSIQTIKKKLYENKKKLETLEQITLAKAEIISAANISKSKGEPFDLLPVIEKNLHTNQIDKVLSQSPKLLLDYLQTIKKTVHISKSYLPLEKVIETYISKLKNRTNEAIRIELLFMLAHTKYRNKKFEETLSLISEVEESLPKCSVYFQKEMKIKLAELKSAALAFTGEILDSITILNDLLVKQNLNSKQKTQFNTTLGIYNFFIGNTRESIEHLKQLNHSEKWFTDHMGMEWTLKKNLMEVILFYELDEITVVESKIRSIERRFKRMLNLPVYAKANSFLSLLKTMMLHDINIKSSSMKVKVENVWEWLPADDEDIQVMMFFAWLKSKILNKPFYDTLLKMVKID